MGDGVVRLASGEEDSSNHDIFIHLSPPSSSSSSPLTVCAPATLLVKVPYFAAQLAEPWIDSPPQLEIALECTPGSSPQDYLQCLRFLTSPSTSWPPRQASVSEVLQILPVADHLLFQECWDTCMAVLASSAWSIEEEDAIRATIFNLNMEPSPDVRERLDTSHDGAALEILFRKMLTQKSFETSFSTWCQKCLHHSSAPLAAAFHSILFKVMESFSVGPNKSVPREWYVLAKIFLQFTDAQQFILYLVNSEELLEALSEAELQVVHQQNEYSRSVVYQIMKTKPEKSQIMANDPSLIFGQVVKKVGERVVLLSNSQRSRLLKWATRGNFSLKVSLAETLPFGDAERMNVEVYKDAKIMTRWMSHVYHRVSQMDEASLKAVCEKFENFNSHRG